MSADNSLIILQTPGRKGKPPEWRIAIVGSNWWMANDIYNRMKGIDGRQPEELTDKDRHELVMYFYPAFKESPVYTSYDEAQVAADKMEEEWEQYGGYIEYGQSDFEFPYPY